MKDIAASSNFTRSYTPLGNVVLTEASFGGIRASGNAQFSGGVIEASTNGTTDGFVFPYDGVLVQIRAQADGSLVEEWTAHPKAMVMSLRHGLALSSLFAEKWMEPSVSDPERVVFLYAVCKAKAKE